jgi:cytochrome c1
MIDSQERLISLVKQELVGFEIGRTSMMPEPPLTQDELADVVAYLLTLKGLQ